jgi:hypothetical protein
MARLGASAATNLPTGASGPAARAGQRRSPGSQPCKPTALMVPLPNPRFRVVRMSGKERATDARARQDRDHAYDPEGPGAADRRTMSGAAALFRRQNRLNRPSTELGHRGNLRRNPPSGIRLMSAGTRMRLLSEQNVEVGLKDGRSCRSGCESKDISGAFHAVTCPRITDVQRGQVRATVKYFHLVRPYLLCRIVP